MAGFLLKGCHLPCRKAATSRLLPTKSFVLSILSIDVNPLFSPLTGLKMALSDMMKGLSWWLTSKYILSTSAAAQWLILKIRLGF